MVFSRKRKAPKNDPEQPVLPPLELKPTAFEKSAIPAELIAARQLPGYPTAVGLLATALSNRMDRVLMDFTAQGVAVRGRIDGVWEPLPPLDRPSGDGALFVIKRLWGMNPADRKSQQTGKSNVEFQGTESILECTSQGTPTGERVLVSVLLKKPVLKTLSDLGMRDKMQEQFKLLLNANNAMVVISAPPGHGLPMTWRVALESADKYIRDWISIENKQTAEPEMINVTQHFFDPSQGQSPEETLVKVLLKQPDAFVLPTMFNDSFVETVLRNVKGDSKHAVTQVAANDPIEAIITLLTTYRSQARELLMTINGVLNQRLVRRLCEECRQAFTPTPQLLQKLGIPRDKVSQLYQPYMPPPPEQRVDAKGNPIEIPICPKCKGRGYFGRVAIFELLVLNNELRAAVAKYAKQPQMIKDFARKQGHLSFQDEGLLAIATGLTSLQELQRISQGK